MNALFVNSRTAIIEAPAGLLQGTPLEAEHIAYLLEQTGNDYAYTFTIHRGAEQDSLILTFDEDMSKYAADNKALLQKPWSEVKKQFEQKQQSPKKKMDTIEKETELGEDADDTISPKEINKGEKELDDALKAEKLVGPLGYLRKTDEAPKGTTDSGKELYDYYTVMNKLVDGAGNVSFILKDTKGVISKITEQERMSDYVDYYPSEGRGVPETKTEEQPLSEEEQIQKEKEIAKEQGEGAIPAELPQLTSEEESATPIEEIAPEKEREVLQSADEEVFMETFTDHMLKTFKDFAMHQIPLRPSQSKNMIYDYAKRFIEDRAPEIDSESFANKAVKAVSKKLAPAEQKGLAQSELFKKKFPEQIVAMLEEFLMRVGVIEDESQDVNQLAEGASTIFQDETGKAVEITNMGQGVFTVLDANKGNIPDAYVKDNPEFTTLLSKLQDTTNAQENISGTTLAHVLTDDDRKKLAEMGFSI